MVTTVGIDFGTSNSALAITIDGSTEVVDISNEVLEGVRQSTLKSVLFIDEEWNTFTGQSAVLQYLHERDAGRFMQSLKAFLPVASFDSVAIYGQRVTLEQLIGFLFTEIKKSVDARIEGQPDRVVIGRPVLFSDDSSADRFAEIRLRSAAEIAGFTNVEFQFEPVAASLAYQARRGSGIGRTVLMGDFGGGTSDFTIIRFHDLESAGPASYDVLAMGGITIGGDVFDGRIMWEKVTPYFGRDVHYRGMTGQSLPMPSHIMRNLCQWHTISFMRDPKTLRAIRDVWRTADDREPIERLEDLITENKGILVFQAIERAKRELSSNETARIAYSDSSMEIDELITRTEFDSFIKEDVELIRACIADTITRAGIGPDAVDTILLTGGSSFIPAVRAVFTEMMPTKEVVHLEAFTSVARGLATG